MGTGDLSSGLCVEWGGQKYGDMQEERDSELSDECGGRSAGMPSL